jgi:hypothetical protein
MEMIEKLAREFVECMYDDGAFGEYDSPAHAADHQWRNYTFAADRLLRLLREPTAEMQQAMMNTTFGKDLLGPWRAGIDAALKPTDDQLTRAGVRP